MLVVCRKGRMAIYRDKNGIEIEYESVPLPTHEVTDAVPLAARIVARKAARKPVSVYKGTDGAELIRQPRSHRRKWTDAQWLAFEEHCQLETDLLQGEEPMASALIIKSDS